MRGAVYPSASRSVARRTPRVHQSASRTRPPGRTASDRSWIGPSRSGAEAVSTSRSGRSSGTVRRSSGREESTSRPIARVARPKPYLP
ncbi:hypothetical protein LUX33_12960 [Actinomadura madurae]|uniref:hypothetical protein n=1 Tax=Actinomadura madurae TaxID=1993 RepID=UPI0020D1F7B5|nr:hypothetical protein [Actinomadura madurae]MCP9949226.1 hypothetical protein [Actinomadura madurae]